MRAKHQGEGRLLVEVEHLLLPARLLLALWEHRPQGENTVVETVTVPRRLQAGKSLLLRSSVKIKVKVKTMKILKKRVILKKKEKRRIERCYPMILNVERQDNNVKLLINRIIFHLKVKNL